MQSAAGAAYETTLQQSAHGVATADWRGHLQLT